MKTLLFTILFTGFFAKVYAQNPSHELKLKLHNNTVLIRWAPNSMLVWKKAIDSGYVLQKIDVNDLAQGSNNWENLSNSTIQPMPLEQMKQKFGEKNMNAALAAQMLYGKNTVQNSDNFGEIIYNSKIEQQNKLGFLLMACSKDFEVAKAVALGYEDSKLNKNAHYAYRLIVKGQDTVYNNIKTSEQIDFLLPEVEIELLEKAANLKWQIENSPFWGYFVEKRKKEDKDWKRTSTSPLVFVNTFKDTVNRELIMIETEQYQDNYQVYEYRLVGIDDFGKESFGPVFKAFGADKTAPNQADNIKAEGVDEQSIKVSWTWNNLNNSKDLVGFRIDKSINKDFYFTPYSGILPTNTRLFLDQSPVRLGNNYYRVAAIDTAGNESYSVFAYGMVYDSVAPSAPQNIKHQIDSQGVVHLTWDKPKENDVFGYRVYFSNYYNHEFINLTGNPIDTNFFSDTINLKTLSKKAYYKVVALDYHFNHSNFSEALELKRPDKIKPQAPFFTSYFTDGTMVRLNWMPSFSDDVDVVFIKRRISGSATWIEIYKGKNAKDSFFEDKNVTRNNIYEYEIQVIDESGLLSENVKTLSVKTIPEQMLEDVSNLSVIFNSDKKQIELNWQFKELKNHFFVVYKSNDGVNYEELDFVEENNVFIDKDYKINQIYFYKIKPVSKKGAAGKASEPVKIQIK